MMNFEILETLYKETEPKATGTFTGCNGDNKFLDTNAVIYNSQTGMLVGLNPIKGTEEPRKVATVMVHFPADGIADGYHKFTYPTTPESEWLHQNDQGIHYAETGNVYLTLSEGRRHCVGNYDMTWSEDGVDVTITGTFAVDRGV